MKLRWIASIAALAIFSFVAAPQGSAWFGPDCGACAKKAKGAEPQAESCDGGCGGCQGGHGAGKAVASEAGSGHRELMVEIHTLIDSHDSITRAVERIESGVVTETRSSDPALVPTLQRHVRQMYELLDSGGSIRHWDPLFVEIFEHADKIEMSMELLDDGIRVRESSKDPYVAKLIQAHADKVDEFVRRGRSAMHEPTEVPPRAP